MILWCLFPQEVYSNGRDFSIQDINAQMATSNLIMRCNLTNTIESDTCFKTASGDKTYVYFGNGYNSSGKLWLMP